VTVERSLLTALYLIDKKLSKVLCAEDDLGYVEDAFWSIDVAHIDSFDWQATSSQRHNHVNGSNRFRLTLKQMGSQVVWFPAEKNIIFTPVNNAVFS